MRVSIILKMEIIFVIFPGFDAFHAAGVPQSILRPGHPLPPATGGGVGASNSKSQLLCQKLILQMVGIVACLLIFVACIGVIVYTRKNGQLQDQEERVPEYVRF